ncbi:MAG: hypothetical protein JNM52_02245, partial [Betaproteobacteria bacterium]|nr:hypothetical protein [Betaproteobacteria bacterium]
MRLSNKLHDLLLNQSLVSAVDVEACLKAAEALRGEAAHAFIDSALADCRALYAEQRSQEALPVARTCVQLADSLHNAPLLIRAKTALGNLLSMSGQWAEAMSLYSDLLQQAATGHDWRTVAANLGNTGNLYYRAGLPQLAMESYQSLLGSNLQAVEALITYRAAYG